MGVLLNSLAITIAILAIYPHFGWKEISDAPLQAGSGMGKELHVPSRDKLWEQLSSTPEFDVVIVGGGATGAGAALEAASRGLKTALIEMDDFGAGTSSRSTKLLHGGVRYLKKAMTKYDPSQLQLVREALHERWILFQQAPHLTNPVPILTPCYSWAELAFSFIQLKLYDWIAYPHIHSSDYISATDAKEQFPQIKDEGLKGAITYYDGQFDDARFNLAVVLSAIKKKAIAVNRAKVIGISHGDDNKIQSVQVKDRITGKTVEVRTRSVINAAGHFADEIRKMDDQDAVRVLQASAGTHIVIGHEFCPRDQGLLITKTDDGRVIFLLPWEGATLAGTTDAPSNITNNPRPTEAEITYILNHINKYFDVHVSRKNVLSAWSGIRPLKKASDVKDTAAVSREHAIYTSPSGLFTIIGGKWTTYRRMAQDVINKVVSVAGLDQASGDSFTEAATLVGAEEYHEDATRALMNMFGLDHEVAHHLNCAYGDQAYVVARMCSADNGLCNRLIHGHPYIEAEVVHAVKKEYALHPVDILERRTRMASVDNVAALKALPRVVDLMKDQLNWSEDTASTMLREANEYFTVSV